jgi:hypothetical protein
MPVSLWVVVYREALTGSEGSLAFYGGTWLPLSTLRLARIIHECRCEEAETEARRGFSQILTRRLALVGSTWSWFSIVLLLVLNGCAGKGETVMLYPGTLPADRTDMTVSRDTLTAVIVPFEDQRPEKGPIGRRTHAGGSYTSYAVWNDMPGYVIAQFMADYLKQKGWQVAVALPGQAFANRTDIDAVITGQVQEFLAQANSRALSTEISVKMRVALQARNQKDGSVARMSLHGSRDNKVALFNDRDVQDALDAMLKDSVDRLMADAKVEQGLLQVK